VVVRLALLEVLWWVQQQVQPLALLHQQFQKRMKIHLQIQSGMMTVLSDLGKSIRHCSDLKWAVLNDRELEVVR